MIIDVHAHFLTSQSGRQDWQRVNESRLKAGRRMGVDVHVASILGTWGHRSPTYFPSTTDIRHANDEMIALVEQHPTAIRAYGVVNPNYTDQALAELERCFEAGVIGVKLAASRRANDPLLDPIATFAAQHHAPVLHHVWQHRRRDWPNQEASDGVELKQLAERHPETSFILAHIGGGGDWAHTLRAVEPQQNIFVDLSGSGVDVGMLEETVRAVGVDRLVWGCDVTMDTGLAKLRHLEHLGLGETAIERITSGTARAIFPPGAFESSGMPA